MINLFIPITLKYHSSFSSVDAIFDDGWLGVFLYKDYSWLRKKKQIPICVSVSPLCICIFVCISLAFATVFFYFSVCISLVLCLYSSTHLPLDIFQVKAGREAERPRAGVSQ